jgi:putative pyoverdin transport system ATP-binding/permease protein
LTFLSLFRLELATSWRQFVFFAALSGLSNAAVLATINAAANSTGRDSLAFSLVLLVLAIIIYSISQKALMVQAAGLAESTVNGMRARFIERLQSADLKDVENLDRGSVYAAVGGEMQVLADGALTLIIAGQAVILLVVIMIYLAFLSFVALALALVFIGIAASIHLSRGREIREQMDAAFQVEARMLQGFTDFLEGFKEVKLSAARSAEIGTGLRHLSVEVAQIRLRTRNLFATDFVASQVTFFLLTGIMVFVVPLVSNADKETIVKITASSLFLIGPISTVVSGMPVLRRVNAAAEVIIAVQQRLSELSRSETGPATAPSSFERIALRGASFHYDGGDDGGFQVGPLDLEISKGQVVFITGGNGSGKSTLLKLMTGLYLPMGGAVLLDDQPIGPANVAGYRELFSAIFSNNHLFSQLYGVPVIDPAEAARLFQLLEMEHKTRIVGRSFETIALSGGQRKRLAMIAALLEHRPICVFDEWAADQDPYFREKFYRTIIPELRQLGKTIIAVTHDDRYFDAADVRIHLEEGRLRPVVPASSNTGAG